MKIRSKVVYGYKVLNALASLYYSNGNSAPYFSLTGELVNPKRRGDKVEACGMLHDELLAVWPELKPLAELHLADIYGVPMHAVENGFYWLAGADPKGIGASATYHAGNGSFAKSDAECLAVFCDLWRVNLDKALGILAAVKGAWFNEGIAPKVKLAEIAEYEKPRWKAEAEAAIKAFDLKVEGAAWAWKPEVAA